MANEYTPIIQGTQLTEDQHLLISSAVKVLRSKRRNPKYWLEEDRAFVAETNRFRGYVRRLSIKLGVLTCASLLLAAIGTGRACASPDEVSGYLRAGAGMSRALATSNHDDPEFGTEPGGFGFVEGGYSFLMAPGLIGRTGVQGLYAPKDEHGHNDKGCGSSPSCQHSADGETLQAGAVLSTVGAAWTPDGWPVALTGAFGVGTGLRSDNGVTYAYKVESGVEVPFAPHWAATAGYQYTDIGGFNFHGPAVGVIYEW